VSSEGGPIPPSPSVSVSTEKSPRTFSGAQTLLYILLDRHWSKGGWVLIILSLHWSSKVKDSKLVFFPAVMFKRHGDELWWPELILNCSFKHIQYLFSVGSKDSAREGLLTGMASPTKCWVSGLILYLIIIFLLFSLNPSGRLPNQTGKCSGPQHPQVYHPGLQQYYSTLSLCCLKT